MIASKFGSSALVVALLGLLSAAHAPQAWSQELSLEQVIPDSAVFALVAEPKKIAEDPALEFLPREIISALGEKELGFDPLEITRLVACVDAPQGMEDPPEYGLWIKFASPQTLAPKLIENSQLESFNGKSFYRGEGPAPSFLLLSSTTLLIGSEDFVKRMAAGEGGAGELHGLLKEFPPANHSNMYLAVKPLRPMIQAITQEMGQLPGPAAQFGHIPSLIDSVVYQTQIGDETKSHLVISANSESDATELGQTINMAMEMGKQMLMAEIGNQMPDDDEVLNIAMRKYLTRISARVQEMLTPKMDGRRLVWEQDQSYGVAGAGVAVALLLPAVQQVREAARRTESMNQLRQFILAMHNYHDANKSLPGSGTVDELGRPLLSWRVHVLPYLEQNTLYKQFHLDEPWDSEHNIVLLDHMPAIYRSPNSALENETVFLAVTGPGTVFEGFEGRRLQDMQDGTSRTIALVEADESHAVPWTKPADWTYDPEDPWSGLGNMRPAGVLVAFCDGSIHVLDRSIDLATLRALMTHSGGEVVGSDY